MCVVGGEGNQLVWCGGTGGARVLAAVALRNAQALVPYAADDVINLTRGPPRNATAPSNRKNERKLDHRKLSFILSVHEFLQPHTLHFAAANARCACCRCCRCCPRSWAWPRVCLAGPGRGGRGEVRSLSLPPRPSTPGIVAPLSLSLSLSLSPSLRPALAPARACSCSRSRGTPAERALSAPSASTRHRLAPGAARGAHVRHRVHRVAGAVRGRRPGTRRTRGARSFESKADWFRGNVPGWRLGASPARVFGSV